MRRRIAPAAAAAALLATVALTGCSAAAAAGDDDCTPTIPSGPVSSSLRVSGETADDLRVRFGDDTVPMSAQRSVIVEAESEGETVREGSILTVNLAYVDAESGEVLQASPSYGTGTASNLLLASSEGSPVSAAVLCASEGETVAAALSLEESIAEGASGPVVVLTEIVKAFEPTIEGRAQSLPFGFPAVTSDESGRPGVVLPPQKAPSELRSAVRIEGDGAKVEAGSTVIGQVLTVDWNGEIVRNTWESGPVNFGNEDQVEQSGATFRPELTGLSAGTQVVVIEPGDGTPVVSVVDILAVA